MCSWRFAVPLVVHSVISTLSSILLLVLDNTIKTDAIPVSRHTKVFIIAGILNKTVSQGANRRIGLTNEEAQEC